jgi:hypothetical protein
VSYFPHAFTGPIEHHDLGTYRYTVLWLPEDIAAQLPLAEHPRLRISGELNDAPCQGAWQPSRGRWYLMLGKPLLKTTGLSVGCLAELRFRVEPQDELEVPTLLATAPTPRPRTAGTPSPPANAARSPTTSPRRRLRRPRRAASPRRSHGWRRVRRTCGGSDVAIRWTEGD